MKLIDYIKQSSSIMIICHMRPDGDCLGAGFALMRICERIGREVDFVCDTDMPDHYKFINGHEKLNKIRHSDYDLGIAVDCADECRLGKFYNQYFECKNTINIDHHITNTRFGNINYVNGSLSSTCELLYSLLEDSGYIDEQVAEYLYMGLSTDTGHFKHSNTTPSTFNTAAKLSEYKFDKVALTDNLYRSNTLNKLRLIGLSISKMQFFEDRKVCVIAFTKSDLESVGCTMNDTEGIIDYPMSLGTVKVAVCMSQQAGNYKVSFRSKGIDVAYIASKFGGGGHKLASGCVIGGDKDHCVARVVEAILEELDERNN